MCDLCPGCALPPAPDTRPTNKNFTSARVFWHAGSNDGLLPMRPRAQPAAAPPLPPLWLWRAPGRCAGLRSSSSGVAPSARRSARRLMGLITDGLPRGAGRCRCCRRACGLPDGRPLVLVTSLGAVGTSFRSTSLCRCLSMNLPSGAILKLLWSLGAPSASSRDPSLLASSRL